MAILTTSGAAIRAIKRSCKKWEFGIRLWGILAQLLLPLHGHFKLADLDVACAAVNLNGVNFLLRPARFFRRLADLPARPEPYVRG